MIIRERRWLWLGLVVFLFPLTLVAGRFCSFGITDIAYHQLVALHGIEPQIVIGAVFISIATVIVRLDRIRHRLGILRSIASAPPSSLTEAFAREADRLKIAEPQVVYVTASTPLCFTALDRRTTSVFVSRGFIEGLDAVDLRLVAHHQLVHIRECDPFWNLIWHVAFSALVFPGFDGVERRLRIERELRANASAAMLEPERYEELLVRQAREGRSLCAEAAPERRSPSRIVAIAPLAIVSFFVALIVSHASFMHDLPYLATHHC